MGLFHRKSAWQRATEHVAVLIQPKSLAKTGLTAAGVVGLTAASAIASSLRAKDNG